VSASTLGRVRWPLGPLLDVAGHPPARILAAQVGVSPRTVWRWHPANIWPHWHNP
jgi:hypothetical protein